MDSNITAAIVGGAAGFAVVGLERGLEYWIKKRERMAEINSRHLNPLRLYSEETYFRLLEISDHVRQNEGCCNILLTIDNAKNVSEKDSDWFNSEGCYLISSCYFTACLFGAIKNVREDMPYLKLRSGDDTTLLNQMFAVSRAFLKDMGVFYAVQHAIGSQMWQYDSSQFLSYREFCEILMNCDHRPWFDRLIQFFLETGKGKRKENIENALKALRQLGRFVDNAAGGGDSIGSRLKSEGVKQ